MDKQFITDLIKPYLYAGLAANVVLSLVVLKFNVLAGLICFGTSFLLFSRLIAAVSEKSFPRCEEKLQDVLNETDELMFSFRQSLAQAICATDAAGHIYWKNSRFEELFGSENDMFRLMSRELLDELFRSESARIKIEAGGASYSVTGSAVESLEDKRLLFFTDETASEMVLKLYNEDHVCLALVSIDNYAEILNSTSAEEQSSVIADMDKKIRNWGSELDAAVFKYRSSNYAVLFKAKYLEELRKNRFSLLDQMHEIESGADFPTSVSMGVSYGMATLAEAEDDAYKALELALGRGGDQAVLKGPDGEPEFFGGTLPTVEKRNKGKSRMVAHALLQQIQGSSRVYIMGHSRPDMDSFGASVGIYALCRNAGKSADIIIDQPGEGIDSLYEAALQTGAYSFVSGEEACRSISPEDLLIVVDCYIPPMCECPAVLELTRRVAVIDHHRRSKNYIQNATLVHAEVYASSASELVAELLQYAGDKTELSEFEAEALLAGITVDTKNFTVNTGVRTFEAAGWLKRRGADNNIVKGFFRQRLEFVQKKFNIIASAEILPGGFAVAYTKESDPSMQVLAAQAADELLDMKGVVAAFAAGRGKDQTMVSARAAAGVNVQTIMEQLGGGGHMNIAAAQVSESPEEAIQRIVEILRSSGMLQ